MLRITEVRPMFTNIVVTGDRYEKDMRSGGLIVANKGDLKLWQTVLAVGGVQRECLLLNDRDILYAFEGEERDEPLVEVPEKGLML